MERMERRAANRRRASRTQRRLPGKLIICLIITAALLFVKLLLPDTLSKLKAAILPGIEKNINYTDAVATIGRAIRGEDREAEMESGTEPEKNAYIALPAQGGADAALEDLSSKALKAGLHKPEAQENEMPEAVAAFLNAQSAYAPISFPEDIDYNMYTLPFETCAPAEGEITSAFGYRVHPESGTVKFHYGTDIGAAGGAAVRAFADGEVLYTADSASYGYFVVLSHAGGYETLYAHCSGFNVSAGEHVSAGDVIAAVGDTGNATGACLHFELSKDGIYHNSGYCI